MKKAGASPSETLRKKQDLQTLLTVVRRERLTAQVVPEMHRLAKENKTRGPTPDTQLQCGPESWEGV